jgi:hypothetical protein
MTSDRATRSRVPYVGIALDHGESFDKWLVRWGSHDRVNMKRALVEAVLKIGVSGVVVGLDLVDEIDSVVRFASEHGADTWFGLPDEAAFRGHGGQAPWSSCTFGSAVSLAAAAGCRGIKIGIASEGDRDWDADAVGLNAWAELAHRRNLELVVEPCFRSEDDPQRRHGVLRAIAKLDSLLFTKLDVHDPHTWSPMYGQAAAPWVARSDGMDFPSFLAGVRSSLEHGCVGTFVGGAIWGILEDPMSAKYQRCMSLRIDAIRSVFQEGEQHAC